SLSGYTSAWQLYLGLFFMITVASAPAGLAGLIAMHTTVARMPAFRGVLIAYAIALVPALVMMFGGVMAIEMSYRLSTQPELGTRMAILGVGVDAAKAWPWIAAVATLVVGFVVFRRTWPIVARAWDAVQQQVAAKGVASR
ncbi:MAG TPA: branched-chain amino acid ABC transporter permease, partial [Casimicrobiaceae bacterium]|nr:branched-chain amino acid ABC transporter permease [Casimicrobiaceae bacterium]